MREKEMTAKEEVMMKKKKKRKLAGNPDPSAEVIALSPGTLMATNRFVCEICGKGFQRDQNLQLHRRGHNLPWKLKQRSREEAVRKRVYVCPEKSCVHHHPTRALGDLTGIKKHFCRKHGDKKWKCHKCSKRYAVHSDWKAHSKTCGTREYKCDCGTIFSRRDSFITHRAFCDALAEETARFTAASHSHMNINHPYHFNIGSSLAQQSVQHFPPMFKTDHLTLWMAHGNTPLVQDSDLQEMHQMGVSAGSPPLTNFSHHPVVINANPPPSTYNQLSWDFGNQGSNSNPIISNSVPSLFSSQNQIHHPPTISATALLQKAAQIGATTSDSSFLGSLGMKGISDTTVFAEDIGNRFCGLYSTTATSGDHVELAAIKRRRGLTNEKITGGETRDFLGVGIHESICHPSSTSINGWI